MGFFSKLFHPEKQSLPRGMQDMLNDAFMSESTPCPTCGAHNTPRSILRAPDGQPCCARCGLPFASAPDEEQRRLALARAKVFDRFGGAMTGAMFAGDESRKQELLEQARQAFRQELARNDPENELVIYRNARREGRILPCQLEGMFLDI